MLKIVEDVGKMKDGQYEIEMFCFDIKKLTDQREGRIIPVGGQTNRYDDMQTDKLDNLKTDTQTRKDRQINRKKG